MLAYKEVVSSIQLTKHLLFIRVSQVALVAKKLSANVEDTRDTGSIPVSGSGRSPGGGNGNPL